MGAGLTSERFVKDVDSFFATMAFTGAVLAGSAVLKLLCGIFDDVHDYDLFVPVAYASFLIEHLIEHEGYSKTPPKLYRPDGVKGCTLNETNYFAGVAERTVLYSVDAVVDVMAIGSGEECDDPLVPVASAWTSLLLNYAGPASICCCFPTLTLRGRGLVQWERALDPTFPGDTRMSELEKYQSRGFSFRTQADDWDIDAGGVMRSCSKSWVCPLMERRFGDRGCLYVTLNSRAMWDGNSRWVFGGYTPCPIVCTEERGRVAEVHNECCSCL